MSLLSSRASASRETRHPCTPEYRVACDIWVPARRASRGVRDDIGAPTHLRGVDRHQSIGRLSLSRARLKRIQYCDTGPLVVRHVARDDGQSVLKRGRGNPEVEVRVTDLCGELAPAPRDVDRQWQYLLAMEPQYRIKPGSEVSGEHWIVIPLSLNATLDFDNRDQ